MRKLAKLITDIIDFFYRPFRTIIPQQVFRYGACGGGNMVLDWVLYFLVYNFVVGRENVYFVFEELDFMRLGNFDPMTVHTICFSPHIFALCIVFPITFLTGFWLNKYVTFTQSSLAGTRQLFRYILIVAVNLAINYFGLKLCVDMLGWYPTPSKVFITIITGFVSFFGQKYFSFRE